MKYTINNCMYIFFSLQPVAQICSHFHHHKHVVDVVCDTVISVGDAKTTAVSLGYHNDTKVHQWLCPRDCSGFSVVICSLFLWSWDCWYCTFMNTTQTQARDVYLLKSQRISKALRWLPSPIPDSKSQGQWYVQVLAERMSEKIVTGLFRAPSVIPTPSRRRSRCGCGRYMSNYGTTVSIKIIQNREFFMRLCWSEKGSRKSQVYHHKITQLRPQMNSLGNWLNYMSNA